MGDGRWGNESPWRCEGRGRLVGMDGLRNTKGRRDGWGCGQEGWGRLFRNDEKGRGFGGQNHEGLEKNALIRRRREDFLKGKDGMDDT